MKNLKIFLMILTTLILSSYAIADEFVPEFDKMKILRCDYEETTYNQDGSVVSSNHQHRIYRIADEYNQLFLQKEPITNFINFDENNIEFYHEAMTDDYMMMSKIIIDRANNKYSSKTQITYDNAMYGNRYAKAEGICKPLN